MLNYNPINEMNHNPDCLDGAEHDDQEGVEDPFAAGTQASKAPWTPEEDVILI